MTSEMEMKNDEKSEARKYIEHLLNDGCKEGIHDAEMELPPWYDEKLYKKAQSYFFKYLYRSVGFMVCGLIAVLSVPTILQVLICTKQSTTVAMAYRRYLQTIFHVVAWKVYPLKKGSRAWESLEIVRKNHFRATKICEKAKSGSITQKDLAITQFGFFGFNSLPKIENISDSDTDYYEALVHYWRVIGYLLGIKDEYNLCADTWEKTKPRLILVRDEIYKKHLDETDEKFDEMTKALLDGLWHFDMSINGPCAIFITKWLCGCKGYKYLDEDFKDGASKTDPNLAYNKLTLYQRFMLQMVTYTGGWWYKYTIVRWYFNFTVLLTILLGYFLPIIATYKFGIKWAYVRIFPNKKTSETNKDD